MCILLLEGVFHKYPKYSVIALHSPILWLIFCLVSSIIVRWVLKSPTIIVYLSISPFSSVLRSYPLQLYCLGHTLSLCNVVTISGNFLCSDIGTLTFFWLLTHNISFSSFYFKPIYKIIFEVSFLYTAYS